MLPKSVIYRRKEKRLDLMAASEKAKGGNAEVKQVSAIRLRPNLDKIQSGEQVLGKNR